MPAKSWIPIRVTRQTHRRLSELRDQLFADYQAGRPNADLPDDQCEHLSFDHLINRLIDRVHAHRQRAKASRSAVEPAEQAACQ